eukprot:755101-Rhodomonas_salina.1
MRREGREEEEEEEEGDEGEEVRDGDVWCEVMSGLSLVGDVSYCHSRPYPSLAAYAMSGTDIA